MSSTVPVLLAGFVEGADETLTMDYFVDLAESLPADGWPVQPPIAAEDPDAGLGLFLSHPAVGGSTFERASLEGASRLLEILAACSKLSEVAIVVEYDGEAIGWIEGGELDEGLTIGFLGEWRRTLDP